MPGIVAKFPTLLKARPIGSKDLRPDELISVPKDKRFAVTAIAPDRDQHLRLELASPVQTQGEAKITTCYGYAPHLELEGYTPPVIKLEAPYFQQNDNDTQLFGPGWRQCCTTSNAMLADFLLKGFLTQEAKKQGLKEAESVYMRFVAKYGDTTDHDAQTQALRDLGIESYYSQTLNRQDLLRSLQAEIPVVVGFAYKSDGHICLLTGCDLDRKVWFVHDPYGVRLGTSDNYDIGAWGAHDEYTDEAMYRIYWDLGKEAGHGRIVTAVKGRSTGLIKGY